MPMTAEHTDDARDDPPSTSEAIDTIEGLPLAERAAAYAQLHDDLARELESSPADGAA